MKELAGILAGSSQEEKGVILVKMIEDMDDMLLACHEALKTGKKEEAITMSDNLCDMSVLLYGTCKDL